jgi:hypothetical protein
MKCLTWPALIMLALRVVLQVPDDAKLSELQQAVHQQLGIPLEDISLSRDPDLLKAGFEHLARWACLKLLPLPTLFLLQACFISHSQFMLGYVKNQLPLP